MPELIGLPYSPWSEKAKWALAARGVPYAFRSYSPMLGELPLRLRLRRWTGVVTVPVLFDDDGAALSDSIDIARWADARGAGPRLFPAEHDAQIARLVELSERGLGAGRAMSLSQVLQDPDALRELVPKKLRGPLGPLAPAIAGVAIRRTQRKYRANEKSVDEHRRELAIVLDEIRTVLGGRVAPLLGAFTFADIAVAQVLAYVEPPASGLRLGRASRRAFSNAELRDRYPDLLAWRDAIYAAHRPKD